MSWPTSVKRIDVPIYGGRVAFCPTPELWEKCAAHMGSDYKADGFVGLCGQYANPEERTTHIVGVFDGSIATLIHELAHCTFNILGRAGVPVVDYAANEAFCYLQDTLYTEAMKQLKLKG